MKPKSPKIFLLTNTPENVLATHALSHDSIERIVQNIPKATDPTLPLYSVWVSREEDLHDFVYQVPDLAWEMLEYAEEPLEIIYPRRKFVSPQNETTEDPISIRLVRGRQLEAFVRRHGPLLTFRAVNKQTESIIDETHDLREKDAPYDKVKSMKLFADGSFTFVR